MGDTTLSEAASYRWVAQYPSGCDLSEVYAWVYMGRAQIEFEQMIRPDCPWWSPACGPDPLAWPGLFIGESKPGKSFDPKPHLERYLSTLGPYNGNLVVDIGDPGYLYYFDVLGNAIWGALAANYLPGTTGMIATAVDRCPESICGQADPGDDIVLRAGIDAGKRHGDDLTMSQILAAIRGTRDRLIASATLPLTLANVGTNKVVPRGLVPRG